MRAVPWTTWVALCLLCISCSDDATEPEPEPPANLYGLGGWTEFDLFAVGDRGTILHYRGGDWRPMTSTVTETLRDVVGLSDSVACAVGDGGTIVMYNGIDWTQQLSPTTLGLRSLWGDAADNWLAVGNNGVILANRGSGWVAATIVGTHLNGVWALPGGEAYAVGEAGAVVHRDSTGAVWSTVTPFTTVTLRAIWADKPDDWFAVGDGGEIWQERGAGWIPMLSPRTDDLYDVFGSDSAFVFIAGDADSILFYDGFDWRPLAPRIADRMDAVWATICGIPFVSGAERSALHCSNTYFAGTSSVVTRFNLLGGYDILNDPR